MKNRTTIICAHILKHLMTTVPIIIGSLITIYAVCVFQPCHIGMIKLIIQIAIGLGITILGCIILNQFEN